MNTQSPVYTQKTECQDCYKCVRVCEFKAIKIEDGHAIVITEACVYCGRCVEVCPAGAKRVRNDLVRLKYMISSGRKLIASVAPSYIACISSPAQNAFINSFARSGFIGVSETALGAQSVSSAIKDSIRQGEINITTCCPVVVEIIRKYYSHLVPLLTPVMSPALAHAKQLKDSFGSDCEVVFVGPCIAKKIEADRNPSLISISVSFDEAVSLFGDLKEEESADFITDKAGAGNYYPVEGGMIRTVSDARHADNCYMAFSGVDEVRGVLDSIGGIEKCKTLVLELMACRGGCINGPLAGKNKSFLSKRMNVLQKAFERENIAASVFKDITAGWDKSCVNTNVYREEDIAAVLKTTGKSREDQQLNCGGCGYDSCRDFAKAIIDKKAERSMCVTYMRRLAQKKANALIKSMPSGVVIADDSLSVIECNLNFARLFIEQADTMFNARPGLEGANLSKILPANICSIFLNVIRTGNDFFEKDIRVENKFYHCSIFLIEKGHVAGGIFQDITSPMMRKKNVIDKAENVINRNLQTVQTIAALLGENAASTEVLLNSIIESFNASEMREDEDE
ncbi:MAG TPA: [Fe-Fe] hydrogenase large subunit C-terminal domain-containing protein [Spirochaetota bacterium]|nr:[Fe-Fe] hydrogenase large subunit C-terminal domain-containing protein [Spirochaetota bacterium]HOR44363.1 [Fe-Fe] hydrogenase large subunit C-terminal domain-containing protein [Spirochaetota bacterium]HPK55842.1 [Fe-Fe] hydrogenase large subunit C-terminal domain-containing protein [Spirochaetota bacterium]